jgi:hypothetical protein
MADQRARRQTALAHLTTARTEVLEFAAEMERVLREHDATKGPEGWKGCVEPKGKNFLCGLMAESVHNVCVANPNNADDIRMMMRKTVDGANRLMMIWDNTRNGLFAGPMEAPPPVDLGALDEITGRGTVAWCD